MSDTKSSFTELLNLIQEGYMSWETAPTDFINAPTPQELVAFLRDPAFAENWDSLNKWESELINSGFPSIDLNGHTPLNMMALLSNFPKSCEAETLEETTKNTRDVLSFLLQVQKIEDKNLNAVVKHIDELETHLQSLSEVGRYQIIVDNEGHYTACDVQIEPDGKKRAIVLDAGACVKMGPTLQQLEKFCNGKDNIYLPFHNAGLNTRIQSDSYNCSNFALDHAIQIARLENVYKDFDSLPRFESETTAQSESYRQMNILTLPPTLIWNAQSMERVIKPYCNKLDSLPPDLQSESRALLDHYLSSGVQEVEGKKVNRSIEYNVRDRMAEKGMPVLVSAHLLATKQMAIKATVQEMRAALKENQTVQNLDNNQSHQP